METHWAKVLDTADLIQAEMILNLLQTHQIACVMMNKRSSILPIGRVEIWATQEHEMEALKIINDEFEDKHPDNQN